MDSRQSWISSCLAWLHVMAALHIHGVSSIGRPEAIYDSPEINATQNRFNFIEGQTAILQCKVDNLGDKKFIWKLASDPNPLTVGLMKFSEDPRLTVRHDRDRRIWTLEIADVRLQDADLYECQISSHQRHLRKIMTLSVTARPHDSIGPVSSDIHISGSEFVNEGGMIRLMCSTDKTVPSLQHMDWFRDGNKLVTGGRVNISMSYTPEDSYTHSILIIRPASMADSGDYVCRAFNNGPVLQRVNVLSDPKGVREGRAPPNPEIYVNLKSSAEDKDAGSSVSPHWMTLLVLSLVCLVFSQSELYSLDCT